MVFTGYPPNHPASRTGRNEWRQEPARVGYVGAGPGGGPPASSDERLPEEMVWKSPVSLLPYLTAGDVMVFTGYPPNHPASRTGRKEWQQDLARVGYVGAIGDGGPPTSPGEMLREEFLKPLGISQRKLAQAIGLPYRQVNGIVHARRPVTPAIALRLTRYLGMSVGFWLNLQLALDLYNAAQAEAETLARIQPFPRPDLEDAPDDGDGGEYAGEYRAVAGESGESTDNESGDGKTPAPAQIQPQAD